MISLIIAAGLIILLVANLQISDRICDEAANKIMYSDEEYSTEIASNTVEEVAAKPTSRMSSQTFTKDFDEKDFSPETEEEAEMLLERIYKGGAGHK